MRYEKVVIILQIICIFIGGIGIGIEMKYAANIGFVLITVSSVFWAISEKISKIDIKRENKNLKKRKE